MPKRKKAATDTQQTPPDQGYDIIGEKGGMSDADIDSDVIILDEEIAYITDVDDNVDMDEEAETLEDIEEIDEETR